LLELVREAHFFAKPAEFLNPADFFFGVLFGSLLGRIPSFMCLFGNPIMASHPGIIAGFLPISNCRFRQ
jgi:hypothetical protein